MELESIIQKFKTIKEVNKVYIEDGCCFVEVFMPNFNREVMKKLIQIEIEIDKETNFVLEYKYIPILHKNNKG